MLIASKPAVNTEIRWNSCSWFCKTCLWYSLRKCVRLWHNQKKLNKNFWGKCIIESLYVNWTQKTCVRLKRQKFHSCLLILILQHFNGFDCDQPRELRNTQNICSLVSSATGYKTLTSVVLSGWINLMSTPSIPRVDERWARWFPHCISTWDTQLSGWDLILHWAQTSHVMDGSGKEWKKINNCGIFKHVIAAQQQ